MPFIKFEKREDYAKASHLEYKLFNEEGKVDGSISCLQGRDKGIHNAVFIYPQGLLDRFNKKGIKYKVLPKKEVPNYLSKGGQEYLEGMKRLSPEFII